MHTDGNHVAGLLAGVLAAEVTTTVRRCGSCGAEHPLAAHRAYHGAGIVLRCPGCGDVAVRVAQFGEELVVEWRGTYRVPAPESTV
jgi:hypothetical protein